MAFLYHIELTNVCDLVCNYCPLTFSERPKGLMSEQTFRKVVLHMQKLSPLNFMILHHFGEPLLHPELPRFVELAAEARLNPGFSTNGETLTRVRLRELIERGLRWLCIAFHTTAGEAAYRECRELAMRHGIVYWGRRLEPTEVPSDPRAILEYGIEHQLLHTFAGTVGPERPRPVGWRPKCDYLDRNFVCILFDGRVVPCAMDEFGTNVLGTVEDLDSIVHEPSYELCRSCQGFTFYEGFRSLMGRILRDEPRRFDAAGWVEPLALDADPGIGRRKGATGGFEPGAPEA